MSAGFTVRLVAHLKASATAVIDTVAAQSAPWALGPPSRRWRGYVGRRSMLYRISWELIALLLAAAFILALTLLG